MTKEELGQMLRTRYGENFEKITENLICISPIYAYFLGTGSYGNLTFHIQDISHTNYGGWDIPRDVDICNNTKSYTSCCKSKKDMKTFVKKVLSGIDPFKEIDKLLDIVHSNIGLFNFKELPDRTRTNWSYSLANYSITLCAIDYSTRQQNKVFRNLKYLDLVWKCIDELDNDDIRLTYSPLPNETSEEHIKRCKNSIINTIIKGELEINSKNIGSNNIIEDIEKKICSGYLWSLPQDLEDKLVKRKLSKPKIIPIIPKLVLIKSKKNEREMMIRRMNYLNEYTNELSSKLKKVEAENGCLKENGSIDLTKLFNMMDRKPEYLEMCDEYKKSIRELHQLVGDLSPSDAEIERQIDMEMENEIEDSIERGLDGPSEADIERDIQEEFERSTKW